MNKILRAFIFLFVITSISKFSFAQWVRKADALKPRSDLPKSIVYNSKLYVFCGFTDDERVTDPSAEVYDPATNTWKYIASMPAGTAVTHECVILIDNTIWLIGGRRGTNPGPLTSEIWIYNISTNKWSKGPDIKDPATNKSMPIAAAGGVLLGRVLHIFGGFTPTACTDDQDSYHLTLDVDTWLSNPSSPAQWKNNLKPLPLKRNHCSSVVLGGKIYAIGGQIDHDCGEAKEVAYCHVYDPSTDSWKQLTSLPTGRSHAEGSTFAIDGKIYMTGGQGNDGNSTKYVTIFDPSGKNGAGSWSENSSLALPYIYEGLAGAIIGNTFVISHGSRGSSKYPQKITYTRTISRNPVYKFGFSSGCTNFNLRQNSSAKAQALLFTIDGSKGYSISSSANWLTITENASGTAIQNGVDIELTANTAGLAPGNYNATITASGKGSGADYTSASYCVKLTVSGEGESLIKINAGGPAITVNGVEWSGCASASTCDDYVSGGGVPYIQNPLPTITGITPPTSQEIMRTEWTGGAVGGKPVAVGQVAFTYTIPVVNGDYIVRLHFVELNKNGAGLRKFDVNIEGGSKELEDFDIFVEAGGMNKAIYRDFPISISDGDIKIEFYRQVQNAKISAIEILPVSAETLEAELAELKDVTIGSQHAGFTGDGFVDYINSSGDYIEWTLNMTNAGPVTLNFRYANGGSNNRPLELEINGIVVEPELDFPTTNEWTQWSSTQFTADLQPGENKIKLAAIGFSGPNIDHLKWSEGTTSLKARSLKRTSKPAELKDNRIFKNLELLVLPNPVSGSAKLFVKSLSDINAEITIMDMLGKIHKKLFFTPRKSTYIEFSVKGLSPGSYFIKVKQGENSSTAKFIVLE